MPIRRSPNLVLGLVVVAFASILLLVWIPLDVESGIVERVRRQIVIGDALAPILAGGFILLGGLMLIIFERNADTQPGIDVVKLAFVATVFSLLVISFLVMLSAGPAVVGIASALTGEVLEYRLLRDTVPWKYVGFALGGVLAITGMISLAERKRSLRALLVGVIGVAAMIAIFDLPFKDLLIPPNGDF